MSKYRRDVLNTANGKCVPIYKAIAKERGVSTEIVRVGIIWLLNLERGSHGGV